MFVGKAKHTVNKDGRVSIPSKMREVIKKKYDPDDLYLILMPGNVVCLYPGKKFEELAEQLSNPPGSQLSEVLLTQRIFARAENCKLDGSGRIVIPLEMRVEAQIDQEVLVIGCVDHMEMWNESLWEFSQRQSQSGLERLKTWSSQPGISQ